LPWDFKLRLRQRQSNASALVTASGFRFGNPLHLPLFSQACLKTGPQYNRSSRLPASTKAKTCSALVRVVGVPAAIAFCLCPGDAFQRPRQHDTSFKLGGRSDDLKHKLAGRIVRIEFHIQDAKGDALSLQPINDFAQMPDRARQAGNFRDNQGIAFARKLDCSFKLFTGRD
jgi:hypothetical protein